MQGLYPIIRRKRRSLLAEGHQPVPTAVVVPVTEPVQPVVELVEITKPKKSRDDAPQN